MEVLSPQYRRCHGFCTRMFGYLGPQPAALGEPSLRLKSSAQSLTRLQELQEAIQEAAPGELSTPLVEIVELAEGLLRLPGCSDLEGPLT